MASQGRLFPEGVQEKIDRLRGEANHKRESGKENLKRIGLLSKFFTKCSGFADILSELHSMKTLVAVLEEGTDRVDDLRREIKETLKIIDEAAFLDREALKLEEEHDTRPTKKPNVKVGKAPKRESEDDGPM